MIWYVAWLLATALLSVVPFALICKVYTTIPTPVIFFASVAILYFGWYKKYAKNYVAKTILEDVVPRQLLELMLVVVVAGSTDKELVATLNAVSLYLYNKPLDVYVKDLTKGKNEKTTE